MPGNTLKTLQPGDDEPDHEIDIELLMVGDREGADPNDPAINPPRASNDRWRAYNIKDVGGEVLRIHATPGVDPEVSTPRIMPGSMHPSLGRMTLRAHATRNQRRLGFGT